MGRLQRNAAQIARYVEHVWPKYERSGSIPETPFDRKERGKSRPPVGDHALDVMDENSGKVGSKRREVFAMLRAELDAIEAGGNNRRSKDGVAFRDILRYVRYDAGLINTWKEMKSKGAAENAEAFWDVCCYVALILQSNFDCWGEELDLATPELEVIVNPKDEQLKASQWQTAHNRDNNERKSWDAKESYKRIYPQWVAFKPLYPDATQKARKGLFCKWYEKEHKSEMSVRRLERAIAYCESGEYDIDLKTGRAGAA